MENFLKAKHWQIFILLILGLFISNFKIENDPLLTQVLKIIGMTTYFAYPLIIGHLLQDYLPRKVELRHTLFIINSFIWLTTYIVIMIISDGQGMTFTGLAAIPMFYTFYAFLNFLAFPAKTIKSIELKKNTGIGDYIGDFFLIVFLPIGIWFLQPRINKIVEAQKGETD
ncbi:hypothetical protein [Xanthovirga aplysinae]|uniref:hypothetical protein n=1 Tax=Xanthovirga aplysinae TaxID=2529853 RepID=UPI0012BD78F6|nr:hypothetical protein [Xanthovirga aplysinae]MTI29322.1 hypothetical protein [Xanthovirga aplysinae]